MKLIGKKTRKILKKNFSHVPIWLPMIISFFALYNTYKNDEKVYSASFDEKIEISVAEDDNQEYIKIGNSNHEKRLSIRKRMEIDLINNSNKGVVVSKISGIKHDPTINSYTSHFQKILAYQTINEKEELVYKGLPIVIQSNQFKKIYIEFDFILGQESTNYINNYQPDIIGNEIEKKVIDQILLDQDISFFGNQKNNDMDELHDRRIFEILIETSNYKQFTRSFSFHEHKHWH